MGKELGSVPGGLAAASTVAILMVWGRDRGLVSVESQERGVVHTWFRPGSEKVMYPVDSDMGVDSL